MRLTFKIDKLLLQKLLAMPETAMIDQINIQPNGMVEFSVQDTAVPDVPGVIETKPAIIDGAWSWNLNGSIH